MGTAVEVRAPVEQSEGTRSQVQRWLKAPGERVRIDEPLLELETDKVTVEIAAPVSGTLHEILVRAEAEVAPGELLATIMTTAQTPEVPPVSAPAAASPQVAVTAPAAARPASRAGGETAHAASAAGPARGRRDASTPSPAVRRLLAERGLEPADVQGTGPGGRLTVDDVLRHEPRADRAPGRHEPKAPAGVATASHLQPHSAMRRRIAERMVESLRVAPHVTTVFEADMTAVLAHRARQRAAFEARGVSLTLTAYVLAACVEAIRAVPEANSRWTDSALELYDEMHIGVATALEGRGLLVPVVRNVQQLDLFGIARELGELVARARADELAPLDVRGGTFTISNHGVSGSVLAAPIIINQPQSAILGVGRLEKRAVVVASGGEDRIVVRPRCLLTLTIDHRVMDGHRANRFLEVLVRQLEQAFN